MNYIVFDLEFTVLRKARYSAEIIEVGAVKLTDDGGSLSFVDLFHSYVRPSMHQTLNLLTTTFTGITQDQVDSAPYFSTVMREFRDWIGEAPYYLCSWGPDDKVQLVKECVRNRIDLDWICNYNDIQLMFTRLHGKEHHQRIGLKSALDTEQIRFLGSHHNALDDAFNTGKLFKKVFPRLVLETNNAAAEPLNTAALVYSTGDPYEGNKPFRQLEALLKTKG